MLENETGTIHLSRLGVQSVHVSNSPLFNTCFEILTIASLSCPQVDLIILLDVYHVMAPMDILSYDLVGDILVSMFLAFWVEVVEQSDVTRKSI